MCVQSRRFLGSRWFSSSGFGYSISKNAIAVQQANGSNWIAEPEVKTAIWPFPQGSGWMLVRADVVEVRVHFAEFIEVIHFLFLAR